ncbi:MAG: energy transducer TonB [Ignavibacteriaceae bacterium]
MKTKLLISTIILLTFLGCKTEKEIEFIPASEIYFQHTELDSHPKLISKDPLQGNKEIADLIFMINDLYQELPEARQKDFILKYNFLVNEEGMIDKVQIIKSDFPEFDKKIANTIKEWKFEPGLKDGKKVKSSLPWGFDPKDHIGKIPMKEDTDATYYIAVDEMPMPIGGIQSIQEKILYPELAKRAGIEGRVFIQAFIDETGSVADAKVIKGVGHGLDEAALEAVKQTKFTPGIHKGEPVKVQVSIPIMFKLESKITIEEILSKIKWNTNQAEIIRNASNYLKLTEHKELKQEDGSSRVIQFPGGTLYGIKTNKWTFALENDSLDFISIEIKSESDSEKTKIYKELKSEIEKISFTKIESHLNEWILSFDKKSIARLQIYPGGRSSDIHILLSSSKYINEQSLQ